MIQTITLMEQTITLMEQTITLMEQTITLMVMVSIASIFRWRDRNATFYSPSKDRGNGDL